MSMWSSCVWGARGVTRAMVKVCSRYNKLLVPHHAQKRRHYVPRRYGIQTQSMGGCQERRASYCRQWTKARRRKAIDFNCKD